MLSLRCPSDLSRIKYEDWIRLCHVDISLAIVAAPDQTEKKVLTVDLAIKLRVPFYRQTSEFTCGPACLMMAMKLFQPDLRLSRGLEFDIWRESNLVESYGTSKEGLALAAARRGFEVYTMGRSLRHSFVDVIRDKIPSVDNKVLNYSTMIPEVSSELRASNTSLAAYSFQPSGTFSKNRMCQSYLRVRPCSERRKTLYHTGLSSQDAVRNTGTSTTLWEPQLKQESASSCGIIWVIEGCAALLWSLEKEVQEVKAYVGTWA